MQKLRLVFFVLLLALLGIVWYQYIHQKGDKTGSSGIDQMDSGSLEDSGGPKQDANDAHPLSIQALRSGEYSGSTIVIEQTLEPGSSYQRYIASYKSEGLKIYALLTVPNGEAPKSSGWPASNASQRDAGWPVIIFNHGYIPPSEYKTTERYIAYTDAFSSNGYIVFRPDYRGHGNSEGEPTGAYSSNGYTIDVLNAISSIKRYKDANPNKIGMWGHSLGGFIALRSMVVSRDIKASVIWGGVVASYPDLINNWRRPSFTPPPQFSQNARRWRQILIDEYGTPETNPTFWNSLSANSYLKDITAPLQLHHATTDEEVPAMFSEKLSAQLKKAGKTVELYTYPGDDHNISQNLGIALERSVAFFDKYLK